MKRVAWLAALTVAACAHQKEEKKDEAPPTPQQEQPEKKEASKPAPRREAAPANEEKDVRPPAEAGRPELAMSPEGLMLDEGPRLIQEALAERGYLAADHQTGKLDVETTAAIRRFQADQMLARTGAPDRETVRKLGLSISKVFKKVTRDEE
jgi:peptidoglycan hydrolase-like protein with peptidoglycan-binding domain